MAAQPRATNAEHSRQRPKSNATVGVAAAASRIENVDGVLRLITDFTPRVKHPSYDLEVSLVTEATSKVFMSTFAPAQKSLYHLYCTAPITLRNNPSDVVEVHGVIDKLFIEIEETLQAEIERLRVIAKNDGASMPSRYSNEQKVVVEVYTPAMTRYVGLLQSMDTIVKMADALWFAMRIKETERNQKMMEWRNKITRFNRTLHMLHMRLIAAGQRNGTLTETADVEDSDPGADAGDLDLALSAPNKAGTGPKPRARKAATAKTAVKPEAAAEEVQEAATAPA